MSTFIRYNVTAKSSMSKIKGDEIENRSFIYSSPLYPHSSHLVDIMQKLDDEYLDLVSITVA